MKSNYKRLGNYIVPVDIRNKEERYKHLLGVSIEKKFIESIANTVGTDFSKYKIIKKQQFAYGPVTSRNGEKISIALLKDYDIALVSQAYTVFEIKDKNQLIPEYLDLWFKRPEFDRYARYNSWGSVREIFDWKEMCNVELPVPEIEKQRKIVEAYNAIENRIFLKHQLNEKFEEMAQTIFDYYFMDGLCESKDRFGDYVKFMQGTQVSIENQYEEKNVNMERFIRIIDYTSLEHETKRYIKESNFNVRVNKSEVVVVRYGNIGLIGRRIDGVIANNLFKVIPSSNKISNNFIYYYLKNNKIQFMIKNSEGNSAMPAIKHSTLSSLPIKLKKELLSQFELLSNCVEKNILKNIFEITILEKLLLIILSKLSN